MKTKTLLGTLLALPAMLLPAWAWAQQESANLPDEYLKNLKTYEFINTRGMMDLTPNRHSWLPEGRDDKDNWELPTPEEIKKLEDLGISFPDFSFITHTDTVDDGQRRQRTHTVEHILYALPGDALSLYPYYGLEEMQIHFSDRTQIESTRGFLETFSHWYDFRTGGRVLHQGQKDNRTYDLLDFPSCRDYMQISDDYGFYGGIYMSPGSREDRALIFEVSTPQAYKEAVDAINRNRGEGTIRLTADLDFSGITDVPMLGDYDGGHFKGVLDGSGHKISNLKIEKDYREVGLIRYAVSGAKVCNLTIDSSCTFQGTYIVGMVAKLDGGRLTVKNVVMNATVRGTRGDGDHCTGAILALCDNNSTDNQLIFENLYIAATIGDPNGTGEKNNTVLCGWFASDSNSSTSTFTNIVFKGQLYESEDLKGAGYIRRYTHVRFKWEDCDWDGDTYVEKHDHYSILYTGCYGDASGDEPAWKSTSDYSSFAVWTDATTPPVENTAPYNIGSDLLANKDHHPWDGKDPTNLNDEAIKRRQAGTSAVFYFPENDGLAKEFLSDRDEYVIAADFSQTFEPSTHLDFEEMTIKEPLVAFRHIFRIRDGREQARELKENNRDFVRRHQHKVSARVNANFQIRLDFPLPTNWGRSGGVTNYYYQNDKEEYHRVKQFGLRVLDGDTRAFKYDLDKDHANNPDGFTLGADIRMRRAEPSENKEYARSVNEEFDQSRVRMFDYHTMLLKPKVNAEAHFIVQVLAKDDSGNPLKTSDGAYMVLMEYDITFLPEEGASLVTEKDLYENDKYKHARDEYMKEEYGEPEDKIDFDNFFAINTLEGNDELKKKMVSYSVITHTNADGLYKDFPVWSGYSSYQGPGNSPGSSGMYHSFYKWPISWNRSGYSFGYNYRYDYNMYMLTTHSENVPYHAMADTWEDNIDGEKGLYDRLYYKTRRLNKADPRVKIRQGYYYYVNAASDPGVSARLNFKITCPGTRVVVSAWVAEFSEANAFQDEPANLSFNFVAVMKDTKERVTLHNFITGYIGEKNVYTGGLEKGEQLGKWLNVYYSFVPRLAEFYSDTKTFDDVDHFELELAHNGRSSAGSDYAIDDIRAYVIPPFADADHAGFACDDSPLSVTVDTSFETLLERSGETEGFEGDPDEPISLYYAFVDKEMIEEGADPSKAIVKGILEGETVKSYGSVTFNSNYRRNDRYLDVKEAGNLEDNTAYRFTTEGGDRLIRFSTTMAPNSLTPGKEYYVVFHPALAGTDLPTEDDLGAYFGVCDECGYMAEISVRHSLKVKLDGVVQPDSEEISVCENQSPVIQLNVWSLDEKPVEVVKDAWFDWFDGSINDFNNFRFRNYPASLDILDSDFEDPAALTLKRALEVFRFHYDEAEGVAGLSPVEAADDEDESLEQWMLDIIGVASAPDASGRTLLHLHQASYVMPPLNLQENQTKGRVKVVAIPIKDLYPGGYKICSSPTEIGVDIAHRTPILRHGLSRISYPEGLVDVPLRIGLCQLAEGDGFSFEGNKHNIEMPVRTVVSTDGKDRTFSRVVEKKLNADGDIMESRTGCLLLAGTNDPEYRHLGTLDADGNETGYLMWVGEITELTASTGNNGAGGNRFVVRFDDDLKLKEGYYYRFRFRFEEGGSENINADDEVICQGQDIFTLKIVPEYLRWTADCNLSWDNDANWRRVASDEILKTGADKALDRRFTDCASGRASGYAPLAFTKVLIDAPTTGNDDEVDGEDPWLYAPSAAKDIEDEYTLPLKHSWSQEPKCANPSADMECVGEPTHMIQYDMTAYIHAPQATTTTTLRCRPWAANSCAEIHFLPGSTIMNQQHLSYDRAWVDVELDPSRWYLLSTPLKDVYAGDFYLPTKKARQETEFFQEIRFDESLNDRFAPAVYQRGWDKATASVYEFGKADARNAAVKTFWSHVYNDVAERYGEGNAFSIKTDVSKADSPADKVLFRLPKADAEYLYYSADGNQSGHKTKLSKDDAYKLNDTHGTLTSATANAGRYFMVGNPFMTYFDIRKFLEANASKLNQKYWLITEGGMIAGSLSDAGAFVATPTILTDLPADPSVIAPMQGFFVEAKEESESIELTYDESMMRRYDSSDKVLTEPTRASNAMLRITSINDGCPASAALLVAGEADHGASVNTFDFRDLGIPSVVFTARDGHALSINLSSDAEGTEIGVLADDDTVTTLIFEGTEHFADLMLFDREENTLTPLPQANGITVKGTVSGRFFLTSGTEKNIVPDSLRWAIEGGVLTVTDTASTGSLSITVCDIVGRVITHRSTDGDTLSVGLESGIFVVRIANANEEKTIKLSL